MRRRLSAVLGVVCLASALAAPALAAGKAVDARDLFGMQYVPKFDARQGVGSWQGSRDRGIAFHRDLGVEVSREGFIWRVYEANGPTDTRNRADFDDAVDRLSRAGIAIEAMVTDAPLWASSAPHPDPHQPTSYEYAPPRGLDAPIFADGTDTPGPNKAINPANVWAAMLDRTVRRYRGRVRYWQVWNEPDYPSGDTAAGYADPRRSWNGSVADYVRLLRVAHVVIKRDDPAAWVVTGGLGYPDYLAAMLRDGAAPYFDALDFHAYGWPGSEAAVAKFRQVHDAMQAVLARHGLAKPMLCSETGYTADAPESQAAYIAKLYPTALALGVRSCMYYANTNPSWKNMGLIDWHTMTQKTLGYWAYKNAHAAMAGVRTIAPLGLDGVEGYRFTRADGPLAVLWSEKPRTVRWSFGARPWQERDDVGRLLGRHTGPAAIAIGPHPVWLDADLTRDYVAMVPNPPLHYAGLQFAKAIADSTSPNSAGPAAAIDLDPDTHWANEAYERPEAWLAVALQHAATVHSLTVKTGPTPPGTWFDVEVSEDGTHYTAVASHEVLHGWNMTPIVLAHPVPARYIRLHWHNPQRRPVSFCVFEVQAR